MKKRSILLFIVILIMTCSENATSEEKHDASSSESNYKITNKTVELKVDSEEQNKIQAEVDRGHQPWRLEPVDVAFAALSTVDKKIDYENCQLNSGKKLEADVICKGAKIYRVYLRRLVRPDGIWTAISIKIE